MMGRFEMKKSLIDFFNGSLPCSVGMAEPAMLAYIVNFMNIVFILKLTTKNRMVSWLFPMTGSFATSRHN